MLVCRPNYNDNPPDPPIIVAASSSSANAPFINSSGNLDEDTNCAQSLADLISAGFVIEDVQPADLEGGGLYTLVRIAGSQN